MDLLQNPFYILKATPRDNRRRIVELADEHGLLIDPNECDQARADLTKPRKRLKAEIAWLPGLAPSRAKEILSTLESSAPSLLGIRNLPPIAKTNLLSAGLSRLTDNSADAVAGWILAMGHTFESIVSEEVYAVVNEDRIVAGFREIKDLSWVESEIQERRYHYRQVMKFALDKLPPKELVNAVTIVADSATNNGTRHAPILIDDLVDAYADEAKMFLDKEADNIGILIEKLRVAADAKQPDAVLRPMVNKLIQVVKNWDTVAQPIQISTKSRGLDHAESHQVAKLVREVAVHLFNEHDKLAFSQQLTNMLQEVFAEVIEIAERTAEDAGALDDIAEQRTHLIEDVKNQTEEWRREITYEADVGVLFKDKLRISPEGIEWKKSRWDLDSITRVRWGGTRHSINGIPSGTTYNIVFGNRSNYSSIELKKETIYTNFIDRLWRTVGVRLMTECLEGLRAGKKYEFGSAVISDSGIELEPNTWTKRTKVFCRWSELTIWNGPGVFCVGKKGEKKVATSFSYQGEDNIHILEAAIRMLWKKGGDRLSSILKGGG